MTEGSDGHLAIDVMTELVHGLLPETERDRARAHLRECASCEDHFRELIAAREVRRAEPAPVVSADGSIDFPRPSSAPWAAVARQQWSRFAEFWRPSFGAGLGLAAAALALIVLWPREAAPPTEPHPWLPGPGVASQLRDPAARGPADDLQSGIEAYERRDLEEAIRILDSVRPSEEAEHLRRIYLGDALLRAGRAAEAADVLATVPSLVLPEPWGPESAWTRYLALRRSGRTAEADSLLRVLAGEPGEIGERASALLP